MPEQILEGCKWCMIISCFGLWIVIIVKFLLEEPILGVTQGIKWLFSKVRKEKE